MFEVSDLVTAYGQSLVLHGVSLDVAAGESVDGAERLDQQISAEGVTLLIADQNVKFARRAASRGYVIEKGTICYQGSLEKLWANEEVVHKYLAV